MRLATIRLADGATAAVRVDGDTLVHLGATDVGGAAVQLVVLRAPRTSAAESIVGRRRPPAGGD